MKNCKKCGEIKPFSDFYVMRVNKNGTNCYSPRCKTCLRVDGTAYYHTLPKEKKDERRKKTVDKLGKEYFKNHRLKNNYGITLEQFNEMYQNQNGLCYICSKEIVGKQVKVDHNHSTGQVRKLLCHNCNTALGLLGENPSVFYRCAEYLKDHINNDSV